VIEGCLSSESCVADDGEAGVARDSSRQAALNQGTVRETFSEIFLEIPGFRELAERELPPGIAAGPSGEGTSGGTISPDPAPSAGPNQGEGGG